MSRHRVLPAIALGILLIPAALFAQTAAGVSLEPTEWSFGAIQQGEKVGLRLTVTNPSSVPVTVTLVPTCGCLTVEPASATIPASGRSVFALQYDSSDDTGIVRRLFIVRTDLPGAKAAAYQLHGVVRQVRKAGSDVAEPAAGSPGAVGGIDLTYYYTPGCRSCEEFLSVELPRIEKALSISVRLQKRDLLDPQAFEELSQFAASRGVTVSAVPALRVGDELLQGDAVIRAQLRGVLARSAAAGAPGTSPGTGTPNASVAVRLAVVPVLVAGLVDGINPCAFTTLIFLLASLALAGRGRREILVIGVAFSFAVFLTYLLVWLGFFAILRAASAVAVVSIVLRWVLVAVLLVFAGMSVYDFFVIRDGRPTEILLQLPTSFKKRIHASIRTRVRTAALIGSSLVLGFLVSIFEFACTGQVYLPTLAYLARVRQQTTAVLLLGLYNFCFILPLLAVFGASYLGVSSQRITTVFQVHMGKVKLALAVVFVGLAVITLVG
jgi:cytochrome c biogenesis protein CcdA